MSRLPAAVLVIAVSIRPAVAGKPAAQPNEAGFQTAMAPFLRKTCLGCHNDKNKSGDLNLAAFGSAASVAEARDTWERVLHKIRTGEMPPKPLPRPKAEDAAAAAGWIEAEFDKLDRAARPDPGRVTARRLNRVEYNNTVRDLLAIDFRPADEFPADDSGYGFDNIGDVLSLSPVLMEKYMAAAGRVARAAVARPSSVKATLARYKAERAGGKSGTLPPFVIQHKFPAEGDYDLRSGVGGKRAKDAPFVKVRLSIDGEPARTVEINHDPDSNRFLDHRVRLAAGVHTLTIDYVDDSFTPALAEAERETRDKNLLIDFIEVRGPFNGLAPPLTESYKTVFLCSDQTPRCARRIAGELARKAFRRPVEPKELATLMGFYEMARQEGEPFEAAIGVTIQAILVSPHFLFRIERDARPADPNATRPVNDFELATRLSYFLWSSMPDDELFRAAAAKRLRQPEVLRAQLRRMLADRKAGALVENFGGQWLQLRNLGSLRPDPDRFPEFDAPLRDAMQKETELFFGSIVRDDRPITEFLDADYTFLNERLARHYGIAGVRGPEFRRVSLSDARRGGILTHASLLTITSYPTRTSPVLRGKWILENILNAPPPAPPVVNNLKEEEVGISGSLRQQFEKHRASPACASCHVRMDPIGFGFENYDAIGRWRTRDGKFDIDASGMLPNGKAFSGPGELKKILLDDRDAFTLCVTEKLLTYALGRGLERYDKISVKSIARRVAAADYRFSALVWEIVDSLPFQKRRGEAPPPATPSEAKLSARR